MLLRAHEEAHDARHASPVRHSCCHYADTLCLRDGDTMPRYDALSATLAADCYAAEFHAADAAATPCCCYATPPLIALYAFHATRRHGMAKYYDMPCYAHIAALRAYAMLLMPGLPLTPPDVSLIAAATPLMLRHAAYGICRFCRADAALPSADIRSLMLLRVMPPPATLILLSPFLTLLRQHYHAMHSATISPRVDAVNVSRRHATRYSDRCQRGVGAVITDSRYAVLRISAFAVTRLHDIATPYVTLLIVPAATCTPHTPP